MKVIIAFTAALLLAPLSAAGEECLQECGGKVDCEVEVVDCLIAAGRVRDAVKHVKALVKEKMRLFRSSGRAGAVAA